MYSQTELVNDLINDLIAHTCQKVSVQESCERCGQNPVEDDNRIHADNQSNAQNAKRFESEDGAQVSVDDLVSEDAHHNRNENRPQFYLSESDSPVVKGDGGEGDLDNVGPAPYHAWWEVGSEAEAQQTSGNAAEEDKQNRNTPEGEDGGISRLK